MPSTYQNSRPKISFYAKADLRRVQGNRAVPVGPGPKGLYGSWDLGAVQQCAENFSSFQQSNLFFFSQLYFSSKNIYIFYLELIDSSPHASLSTMPFNLNDYQKRLAKCLHIYKSMVQEDHLAYEMIACKFPWLVKFHARNGLSRTLYSSVDKVSFFGRLSIPAR